MWFHLTRIARNPTEAKVQEALDHDRSLVEDKDREHSCSKETIKKLKHVWKPQLARLGLSGSSKDASCFAKKLDFYFWVSDNGASGFKLESIEPKMQSL